MSSIDRNEQPFDHSNDHKLQGDVSQPINNSNRMQAVPRIVDEKLVESGTRDAPQPGPFTGNSSATIKSNTDHPRARSSMHLKDLHCAAEISAALDHASNRQSTHPNDCDKHHSETSAMVQLHKHHHKHHQSHIKSHLEEPATVAAVSYQNVKNTGIVKTVAQVNRMKGTLRSEDDPDVAIPGAPTRCDKETNADKSTRLQQEGNLFQESLETSQGGLIETVHDDRHKDDFTSKQSEAAKILQVSKPRIGPSGHWSSTLVCNSNELNEANMSMPHARTMKTSSACGTVNPEHNFTSELAGKSSSGTEYPINSQNGFQTKFPRYDDLMYDRKDREKHEGGGLLDQPKIYREKDEQLTSVYRGPSCGGQDGRDEGENSSQHNCESSYAMGINSIQIMTHGAVAIRPPLNVSASVSTSDSYDSSGEVVVDRFIHSSQLGHNGAVSDLRASCHMVGGAMFDQEDYAVEAYEVQDDERQRGSAMSMWWNKPMNQGRLVGGILLAGVVVGGIVVLVLYLTGALTRQSLISTSPTASPTSWQETSPPLTAEQIACNFLGRSNLAECRTSSDFDTFNRNSTDQTVGSTIPSEIGVLTQLRTLLLDNSSLTGSIPSSISSLTRLTVLSFSYNNLTGSIPHSIASLTELEYLWLDFNLLTSSLPSSISNLKNLRILDVSSNRITGSLPSVLTNLTDLEAVDLSQNEFAGSIPSLSSALTKLTYLDFFQNRFNGTIPSSISMLTSLSVLDFFQNALTGMIPEEMSRLTNLTALGLHRNALQGTIPSSMSSLTLLTFLSFSENKLTGTIPSTFANLTRLESLSFFDNEELSGSVPSSLCFIEKIWIDCGKLICTCCVDALENKC